MSNSNILKDDNYKLEEECVIKSSPIPWENEETLPENYELKVPESPDSILPDSTIGNIPKSSFCDADFSLAGFKITTKALDEDMSISVENVQSQKFYKRRKVMVSQERETSLLTSKQKRRYTKRRRTSERNFTSRMNDLKLIELVREHKCLYDARSENYKDVLFRDNVWKEISDEMSQPVTECKNRWRNVRDTFMRHKRNRKLTTGTSRPQKFRKWHLEGYLEFLPQVENEIQMMNSIEAYEKHSDNWEDQVTANPIVKLEPNIQEDNEIEAQNLEQDKINEESPVDIDIGIKQRKQQKRKLRTKINNSDKILDFVHNNSLDKQDFFRELLKKREEPHPLDLFFNSMAASVKQLSMERQIHAKMQISQLVGKLELEDYASRLASAVSTET